MARAFALPQRSTWLVVSRVAASLLGGWLFVWGGHALGLALLLRAGMTFSDVQSLLGILSFLVFLGVFCWSHGEPSLKRVWAVLAGGGAIMTLLGWLLLPG